MNNIEMRAKLRSIALSALRLEKKFIDLEKKYILKQQTILRKVA